MFSFILFAVFLPSIKALCLVQSCDKYWSTAKNDPNVKKACAVLFDENCCKATKPQYVVPKGESGRLCGVSGSLFSGSCKGPKLKDDVESLLVMPGCKLEVWDKGDGQEQAAKEEKKICKCWKSQGQQRQVQPEQTGLHSQGKTTLGGGAQRRL